MLETWARLGERPRVVSVTVKQNLQNEYRRAPEFCIYSHTTRTTIIHRHYLSWSASSDQRLKDSEADCAAEGRRRASKDSKADMDANDEEKYQVGVVIEPEGSGFSFGCHADVIA